MALRAASTCLQTAAPALEERGISPKDLNVFVGSATYHRIVPARATALQQDVGIAGPAFDIATSSFEQGVPVIGGASRLFEGPFLIYQSQTRTLSVAYDDTIYSFEPALFSELEQTIGIKSSELKGVLYHHQVPGLARALADKLGAKGSTADIINGCAAFNTGIALAAHRAQHFGQYTLVIGTDCITPYAREEKDRILFGDAAGAALIGPSDKPGFTYFEHGTDGSQRALIEFVTDQSGTRFVQQGHDVMSWVCENVPDIAARAVLAVKDAPAIYGAGHQPNKRGCKLLRKLKVENGDGTFYRPSLVVPSVVEHHGNCATATSALTLHECFQQANNGDAIASVAYGAGMSYSTFAFKK